MFIYKFGGASVKDTDSIKNIKNILTKNTVTPLVVVVSAMGKTTNLLEDLVVKCTKGESTAQLTQELKDYHYQICEKLMGHIPRRVEKFISNIESATQNYQKYKWIETYDQIVPYGELLSTSIVSDYLANTLPTKWMDARRFIATDDFHTEANIEWDITERAVREILEPILEKHIVITQGFIGSNAKREMTTLGREGSDFTASILAYCLNAKGLTVWKDVPGILNADPNFKPDAEQFSQLSYQQATEMTYYGAKVIHPKTLKPLAQKNIPLTVRSFKDDSIKGTLIYKDKTQKDVPVFIFKENQILFTVSVTDNNFMDEKRLSIILNELDKLNVKINLMQNSALTFSFSVDYKAYKFDAISTALSSYFKVTYESNLKLITIKNYTKTVLDSLPITLQEEILVQKTIDTYQLVYK